MDRFVKVCRECGKEITAQKRKALHIQLLHHLASAHENKGAAIALMKMKTRLDFEG